MAISVFLVGLLAGVISAILIFQLDAKWKPAIGFIALAEAGYPLAGGAMNLLSKKEAYSAVIYNSLGLIVGSLLVASVVVWVFKRNKISAASIFVIIFSRDPKHYSNIFDILNSETTHEQRKKQIEHDFEKLKYEQDNNRILEGKLKEESQRIIRERCELEKRKGEEIYISVPPNYRLVVDTNAQELFNTVANGIAKLVVRLETAKARFNEDYSKICDKYTKYDVLIGYLNNILLALAQSFFSADSVRTHCRVKSGNYYKKASVKYSKLVVDEDYSLTPIPIDKNSLISKASKTGCSIVYSAVDISDTYLTKHRNRWKDYITIVPDSYRNESDGIAKISIGISVRNTGFDSKVLQLLSAIRIEDILDPYIEHIESYIPIHETLIEGGS